MTKPPVKKPDVYRIEIDQRTFNMLYAISKNSHLPIPYLVSLAVNLFELSTRHMNFRFQPPLTEKPLNAQQREEAIAGARSKRTKPTSVSDVLKDLYHKKGNPQR